MASIAATATRVVVILFATVLLAACQLSGRLAVAPGATSANLGFVLSAWSDASPGKLRAVYVSRCTQRGSTFPVEEGRVWSAWVKEGAEPPTVGAFAYGANLGGLTTREGPEPIVPGCYIARAYAEFPDNRAAVTAFIVGADGSITSLSDV